MKILDPETRKIVLHCVRNFVAVLVIFAIAIALTYVEDYCKASGRPPWLCYGVTIVSMFLFILDAGLFCGSVAALGLKMLRKMFNKHE